MQGTLICKPLLQTVFKDLPNEDSDIVSGVREQSKSHWSQTLGHLGVEESVLRKFLVPALVMEISRTTAMYGFTTMNRLSYGITRLKNRCFLKSSPYKIYTVSNATLFFLCQSPILFFKFNFNSRSLTHSVTLVSGLQYTDSTIPYSNVLIF